MRNKIIIGAVLLLIAFGGTFILLAKKPVKQEVVVNAGIVAPPSVTINNHQISVRLAQTTAELTKGLGGVTSLGADEGMLFIFPTPQKYTFWMKDMLIDLDFVWIRDGRVVDLTRNVSSAKERQKDVITPREPVNYVLEVPAGTIARDGIAIGDEVSINK